MPRLFLSVAIWTATALLVPVTVTADDSGLAQKVTALEETIAQLKTREQEARAAVIDTRTKLQTLEQQRLRQERLKEAAAKSLEELAKQKPEKEAAAAKAQIERTAAAGNATAAEQAYNGVKDNADVPAEQKQSLEQALAAARQALEAADKALVAPTSELLKLLESITVQTQQQEQTQAEFNRLNGEIETTREALAAREKESEALTAERLGQERGLQQVLVDAGRWVSFTDEVAPILHQRCLACHNARTAKGRLNLESYASLRQGGESGTSVVPGNTEESSLCTVLADGSMPLDAEPLSEEQVHTLNRWVEFGGRLDAGVDPVARLIQIMPRRPQPAPPEHYPAPAAVTAIAFSPDGSLLATAGYHEVLLWNVADGSLVRRLQNIAETVYGLSFHPGGEKLAVAAGTPGAWGEVKVLNVADGALLADLVRMEDVMLGVAYSPDGSKLAACGADRSIRTFDTVTGAPLVTIEDHADWVLSLAWSPDGAQLASASRDKTSKVFDANSGNAIGTFNGHGDVVYGVAFSADGKQTLTCGADKRIRLRNVADSKEVRRLEGAQGDVLQIALLPDGRVASVGSDRSPRIHQSADGKVLTTLTQQPDWVYSVAAHPDSNQLATGCADGTVRLWKLDSGESLRDWRAAP